MHREQLRTYLDSLFEVERFQDYSPNGLQVEGREEVKRVICGVTASQALLDEAVKRDADGIIVHHGWFWRGDDLCVTGMRRRRLATIIKHDINLFAYHLPLDAHPSLGNNARLAMHMGWSIDKRFGEQGIACLGNPGTAGTTLGRIASSLEQVLGRPPLVIGENDMPIRHIAWCSGGAQNWFELAIRHGADCYVSGEISEQTVHMARESGVAYIAAGHHATERYGVMALAEHLTANMGINSQFVDIANPV